MVSMNDKRINVQLCMCKKKVSKINRIEDAYSLLHECRTRQTAKRSKNIHLATCVNDMYYHGSKNLEVKKSFRYLEINYLPPTRDEQ